MKILRIDTTYWLIDYLNRALSTTNYVYISKRLVVNIFAKFKVTLEQHIKDSIPLPLATMGRLNRLVTVR